MYRPITYLCAKLTEELSLALLSSICFCCVVFFALELPGSFALFFLTYYQTTCIGIGAHLCSLMCAGRILSAAGAAWAAAQQLLLLRDILTPVAACAFLSCSC